MRIPTKEYELDLATFMKMWK